MDRTLVLQKAPEHTILDAFAEGFGSGLACLSKPLPNYSERQWLAKVVRVTGPRAFRMLLGVTLEDMGMMVSTVVHQLYPKKQPGYTKGTVSEWERPERGEELKRGYWKRRWMPRYVEHSYHWLILFLIAVVTNGARRGRVTGKRVWRVTLRRV